jgi:UDP:flavonoid glycosyltransferase YjiC (YdhE family)
MIGERIDISLERVHIIRDYPNSMYFNAFDATVQAGGYNSFHEVRNIRLPTLFYPNMETGMDDQLARCNIAEKEGWGIVLKSRKHKSIHDACSKLLSLEAMTPDSQLVNGATELSLGLINYFEED